MNISFEKNNNTCTKYSKKSKQIALRSAESFDTDSQKKPKTRNRDARHVSDTHVSLQRQEGCRLGDHVERPDASLPLLRLHSWDHGDPLAEGQTPPLRKQVIVDLFIPKKAEMSKDDGESWFSNIIFR